MTQDLLDQRAEFRRARQVAAVAGEVDAGQNDLAVTVGNQPLDIGDDRAHRY